MPYVEKQPDLMERLADILGLLPNPQIRPKTFTQTPGFNPMPQANAATMPAINYNPAQASVVSSPDQIIREGINKHVNGDYQGALDYFLRAKNTPGNKDANLDEYILRTQRLLQGLKEKGFI